MLHEPHIDVYLAAGEEVRRKTISKLNQHQRVIYEVLEVDGPLIQREMYERYSEAHDDPVTLRYLREAPAEVGALRTCRD